jgi:hypothetical protein
VFDALPEHQLIAVEIDDVEIAHAVVVIFRRFDDLRAARDELCVNVVDGIDKDAKCRRCRAAASRGRAAPGAGSPRRGKDTHRKRGRHIQT